jgi:type VI secretion system protein ImpL
MSALLRNRWLQGGLALAAFALVAWFTGDLAAMGDWRPFETEGARAALIACAAFAWVGWELWRAARARRENARLLEALAAGGEGAAADSAARAAREIALLRQRFEEAAATLKSARFRGADGEGRYVSELPWYVFIGAPGSGKTTALANSGLRFPLRKAGEELSLAGVGGTRNCDWWFTEDAVLLDTAGRYTTQASDAEADAAAWLGFLGLIKRFRPRRPLNGALVTLSVSDLMLWSEEERRQYAWHVRSRVTELYERLGARFPVYVLVTKADLLAGFMEFFGELDAQARARVWGATFVHSTDGFVLGSPGQRFAEEFRALEERLYGELLERMQEEPDLQRRAAAYRFPQQFHGLGPLLEQFLDAAFIGVPGAPAAMLRGVYFTSGTQEGSPIDRVLGALARSFRLERAAGTPVAPGSGKSFFLTRLLREVIFAESGLAGSDERLERRARRLRGLAYAAIAAIAIGLGAHWTAGYFASRHFIAAAEAGSAKAKQELAALGPPRPDDAAQLLRALDALRSLPGGYADQAARSAPSGAGLSQAGKIGAQAQRAYRNALADALFPRLALALEEQIRQALRSPAQAGLREALEAYQDLYAGGTPDPATMQAAALRSWRLSGADGAALLAHLKAGLEQGAPEMRHPQDEAIIREARQKLTAAKAS